MKKLVLLAVGAILFLGVVAVGAVLIASRDPDGAPGSGAPAVPPAPPARPGAGAPVAPSGPAAPAQIGYPPGPRHVQLPAGRVKDGPAAPDRCIREELFTVTGMLHDPNAVAGSPLSVTRASCGRTDGASKAEVTFTAPAENLTIQAPAKCSLPSRRQLRGTSNVLVGNTTTIHEGATVPANPTAADIIGTTPVVNGARRFQGTNVGCASPISIKSRLNAKIQSIIVQIK